MSSKARCPRCGGTEFESYSLTYMFCKTCGAMVAVSDLVHPTDWQLFKERLSKFWRNAYRDRKSANDAAFEMFETFFDCAFKAVGYGFGFTTGVVMFFGWCKLFSIIFGE